MEDRHPHLNLFRHNINISRFSYVNTVTGLQRAYVGAN